MVKPRSVAGHNRADTAPAGNSRGAAAPRSAQGSSPWGDADAAATSSSSRRRASAEGSQKRSSEPTPVNANHWFPWTRQATTASPQRVVSVRVGPSRGESMLEAIREWSVRSAASARACSVDRTVWPLGAWLVGSTMHRVPPVTSGAITTRAGAAVNGRQPFGPAASGGGWSSRAPAQILRRPPKNDAPSRSESRLTAPTTAHGPVDPRRTSGLRSA